MKFSPEIDSRNTGYKFGAVRGSVTALTLFCGQCTQGQDTVN